MDNQGKLVSEDLKIEIIRVDQLTLDHRAAIHSLCNRAYEEDLETLFETFTGATHVLGLLDATIVSHAMWVMRWLQPGDGPLLCTAYVEDGCFRTGLSAPGLCDRCHEATGPCHLRF